MNNLKLRPYGILKISPNCGSVPIPKYEYIENHETLLAAILALLEHIQEEEKDDVHYSIVKTSSVPRGKNDKDALALFGCESIICSSEVREELEQKFLLAVAQNLVSVAKFSAGAWSMGIKAVFNKLNLTKH